jgi:hypothetical protein
MSVKVKETKQEKEQEVSMTVYVPMSVHRILKVYETKIERDREADYTISQAYSEALKEFSEQFAKTLVA